MVLKFYALGLDLVPFLERCMLLLKVSIVLDAFYEFLLKIEFLNAHAFAILFSYLGALSVLRPAVVWFLWRSWYVAPSLIILLFRQLLLLLLKISL